MGFFKRDIRIKITVIFLLVVVVSLVASFVITYTIVDGVIRDNIEDRMLDSTRLTRNLLDVALERRQSRIRLLVNYPVIQDPYADPASKGTALRLFIDTWPIGKGAILLDTAGNVLGGTGHLAALGNSFQTRWFKNAQTSKITFTYIQDKRELTGAFFDSPVLAVSSPVRDPRGRIFSYLVLFTSLSDIDRAIDSVKMLKTGHAFLADTSGNIIAGTLFDGLRKIPKGPEGEEVEAMLTDMARGFSGRTSITFRGKEYLATCMRVEPIGILHPELDWIVGVIVPTGEAYAPAKAISWSLLGLAIFIILCSVIAAILLGRHISRPIEELAKSAELVGSGDLTCEVVVQTRDQIGALAESFTRMRDYLRSALVEAGYSADKMKRLAEDQSSATTEVFKSTEEIVESVVLLARNVEAQAEKILELKELAEKIPAGTLPDNELKSMKDLLDEAGLFAQVGAGKSVEIATAAQDQRTSAREVAVAARRLQEIAGELNDMVWRFKV